MNLRLRFSAESKIYAVNEYLQGRSSSHEICERLGINVSSFRQWVKNYEAMGPAAFSSSNHIKRYSEEIRAQAVKAYLSHEEPFFDICKRFGIRSTSSLRQWIKMYNGHEKPKSSRSGGKVVMTRGRTTTFNERVEIASYCIEHGRNYAEAAAKFNVSYQQARSYTVKYEKGGIQGLQDNRGKRKTGECLSEVEKLRAELKLERSRRINAEMEASFLKKLDEIERRRG